MAGFTSFPEFEKNPPADKYLSKKPTMYWDPKAKTEQGTHKAIAKVPYGTSRLRIKVEGITLDGIAFYKVMYVVL